MLQSKIKDRGKSINWTRMVITAPVLVLFLLGVFEIGFAIWDYLVLTNINQEITRFVIRPGYMNFSSIENVKERYYLSIQHSKNTSASDQLDLDFTDTGNTTLIMSHVVVDTGLPCEDIHNDPDACDCDAFVSNPDYANNFTLDDLIINPSVPGQEYRTIRFGPPETDTGIRDTRLDYQTLVDDLAAKNNKFNCEIIKRGGILQSPSNSLIITEMFYDRPRLFGVSLISVLFTDLDPLYTDTSMSLLRHERTPPAALIGPVCIAYPIAIYQGILDDPDNPTALQFINVVEGDLSNNFGWVTWNPDPNNNNEHYLENELRYPQMSRNDFIDANEPTDIYLSTGDDVSLGPDTVNSDNIDELLQALVGTEIIVPVYDNNPGNRENAYYHISHFARIKVDQICLPAKSGDNSCGGQPGSQRIDATFIEYVDELCGADP